MSLILDNVGFRFHPDRPWLVRNAEAEFRIGTMNAVAGPSGSGKSTLLNLIGHILRPTEGNVMLPPVGVSEAQASIGTRGRLVSQFSWILQTNTVLGGRTVLDNAALGLLAQGYSHTSARAAALIALERFGLAERNQSKVAELSGGELQRITIARCLLSPAPILIADEPTGQLDGVNTTSVALALRETADAGKVVIVATHDERVANLCDSVFDLSDSVLAPHKASQKFRDSA